MCPSQAARSLIGLDRRQIEWINQHHVIEDGLDEASTIVVNGYHRFLLTRAWGSGKQVSADGTQWDTYERNLLAERHIPSAALAASPTTTSRTCTSPCSAASFRAVPTRACTSWTLSIRTKATFNRTPSMPIPMARAPAYLGSRTSWVFSSCRASARVNRTGARVNRTGQCVASPQRSIPTTAASRQTTSSKWRPLASNPEPGRASPALA